MRPLRVLEWKVRLLTSRWRSLPDFVIIGAPRCGTTTLFRLLSEHPEVMKPYAQEVHFFNRSWVYAEGTDRYRACFPLRARTRAGAITGEGTSVYMFRPDVAERMRETIPDARLMVIVRDPVDRAVASWHHYTERGEETRSLEEAVDQEIRELGGTGDVRPADPLEVQPGQVDFAHVHKGRYADQLQKWFALFPRQQIHVIKSENLFTEPTKTYNRVLEFLDLRPAPLRVVVEPEVREDPPGSAKPRAQLESYFKEPNLDLARLLGWSETWTY